jgi:dolichol-phosphate mannosyltransferase
VGRLLVIDGVLTLWVTLSLFAAYEAVTGPRLRWGWWLLAALASGLGVLTKGPVALILLTPPLAAHLWLNNLPGRPSARAVVAYLGVILAVTLPWYIAASILLPQFPRYFFWEHNVVRFMAPFAHREPVWFWPRPARRPAAGLVVAAVVSAVPALM